MIMKFGEFMNENKKVKTGDNKDIKQVMYYLKTNDIGVVDIDLKNGTVTGKINNKDYAITAKDGKISVKTDDSTQDIDSLEDLKEIFKDRV